MNMGNSRVYLVGSTDGLFKIGFSRDVDRRVREIASDGKISLLHTIGTGSAINLERDLHRRFKSKLVGREWFALNDDDVRLIRSLSRCMILDDYPAWLRMPARAKQRKAMPRSRVGIKIRELRLLSGVEAIELALVVGITRAFLYQIEAGRVRVSIETASRICRRLGVSMSVFDFLSEPEELADAVR